MIVGNRVRVINPHHDRLNTVGVVKAIGEDYMFPIRVEFDDLEARVFKEEELELVQDELPLQYDVTKAVPKTPLLEHKTIGEAVLELQALQTRETEKEKTVYNTNIKTKAEHFDKFAALIGNQFKHGGDKYALPGFTDREATDVISAVFGGESEFDWILGTMAKYLFRFKNFHREKDLLKIATYCYILWLKQGNHLNKTHDEDTAKGATK